MTYVKRIALLEATIMSKVFFKLAQIEVKLTFSCRKPKLITIIYTG